ncbi:putative damage-inducible protein DinB [Pedobacter cryoconitis]|uniref:Putative damage-inducible protein DinB n=1 Tax=Pedobacter cryoconitis TaxID=188932 RepID=A0A7W8YS72_9SPHI|nr:DinB family protein [Pedobacter cryoconitis]MBB5620825.1 putative damage-inducible protein DinB [Pedobacter cryoconitis]MBB5645954.1 putative damage-inducible protein DinB [Pedobacter cryoconitis]
MTTTDLMILNFEEIRRRSSILWKAMPEALYNWQPDYNAMTSIQMVRHVLEGEFDFHKLIENKGSDGLSYTSPWKNKPFTSVSEEIEFSKPFRKVFLECIRSFSADDLSGIIIIRKELGQLRNLGDFIQRIAYHEAVHTGQFLSYMRTLNINRPKIWD